ncbi:hypothetical protein Mal35_40080 [Gimesia maris]|uniref:hypothetical protein n=1 Tax=Gimesia maris TaxID=122 RepID=UPI00118A7D4E|nr:hypothetical protein [Gimesia maris]QDT80536.1 hypothetical protein Mal35_40080 [Gimesia maris]
MAEKYLMRDSLFLLLLLSSIFISGCDDQPESISNPADPTPETVTTEQILKDFEEAERAAAKLTPPDPVITLPEVAGWTRSEPRSLPQDDHGFSVAYDHPAGIVVTLYQFTRGLTKIPNDLNSDPPRKEMQRAQTGIQQAVKLGIWKAASETDQGIVPLGDSRTQALWSRYSLTRKNDESVISDTYIWPHANVLLKLRCSGQFQDSSAEAASLKALLTAIGTACQTDSQ